MVVSGYAMKKVSGDTEVCRNDGVNGAAIYIGSLITESPFSGKIYQYGNYSDGEWWEIGSTGGYA